MNELLSIVVPMYNVESTISDLLFSLFQQTYSNIEILLIDDGSIDRTATICKSWCENDKRFKYFYKENGGVGDARNYGIERANGDWVAFPDADDKVSAGMYETLMSKLEGDIEAAMCNQVGHGYMVSGRYNYKDPELFNKPGIGFVNSGVFRKELLFPKLNLFEDNLFVYAFLQTHTALVIPERLYTYNRHTPHSLSKERNNYSKEWLQDYLKIADEYIFNHFTDKDYREKYTEYLKRKVAKLKHR